MTIDQPTCKSFHLGRTQNDGVYWKADQRWGKLLAQCDDTVTDANVPVNSCGMKSPEGLLGP